MQYPDLNAMLIEQARFLIDQPDPNFPVQVFHCREMQSLHRVHFFQPTLMLVLRGTKQISGLLPQQCPAGNLILVAAGHEFPFANVPDDFYMALAIGFEPNDFERAHVSLVDQQKIKVTSAPESLFVILQQLLQLHGCDVSPTILASRRQELAKLLRDLKLDVMLRSPAEQSWENKVTQLLVQDIAREWTLADVCLDLGTSESNLRRKLQNEGRGFRELLEDLRLTFGLGMIQTTHLTISQIALECGYQSISRFTERFKKRFHTTPTELRKAL